MWEVNGNAERHGANSIKTSPGEDRWAYETLVRTVRKRKW